MGFRVFLFVLSLVTLGGIASIYEGMPVWEAPHGLPILLALAGVSWYFAFKMRPKSTSPADASRGVKRLFLHLAVGLALPAAALLALKARVNPEIVIGLFGVGIIVLLITGFARNDEAK